MEKRAMTFKELCEYTGYAKSYLYKKSMEGLIPGAHKPGGKNIFFDREVIDKWLLGDESITAELNKIIEGKKKAAEEREIAACTYVTTHK